MSDADDRDDDQNSTPGKIDPPVDRLGQETDGLVIITDWKMGKDGRLTVPKDKREKYGIEKGDYVDGILVLEDQ